MRRLLLLAASICLPLVAIALAESTTTCNVKLGLVDSATGKTLAGLVQVRDENGKLVVLAGLLSRGLGFEPGTPIRDWSMVTGPVQVTLPTGRYTVRAFSGLETELAEAVIDLTGRDAIVRLPLVRFYDAAAQGYRSANTHLHLRKLSRDEADRYLIEAPLADGLDVVFLSYLERAIDDLEYTSNKYTRADLARLSKLGARIAWGEEHRHNFLPQSQGYGHVMLLNIPELIQPVSIGPGIAKRGTDSPPLRVGIEQAREAGGTAIWCHNQWGLESIPNWIMGRLDANNIFDGGAHGSFKHSFYRYLNAGLRVPFSTGTDWFMYDFSRVYVPASRPLSPEEWLEQLSAGRSLITNGPLLELKVSGEAPGATIDLSTPGNVRVAARAVGRVDFERIELIQNGNVVAQAATKRDGGHSIAALDLTLSIDKPCWLALRTPPPPLKGDPEFQSSVPKNEFGGDLFAHTSAVYVTIAGASPFDIAAAQSLLDEMHASRKFILANALFADDDERKQVLSTYDEAIEKLSHRIDKK
jgi:hypothetical protein